MISWFIHLAFGIFKILKEPLTKNKFSLILFWTRIKINTLKAHSPNIKSISFLGYTLSYLSNQSLSYLVEEIFIHHIYHFKTDHPNPLIFDAGANIGLSILYFKKYYPGCHIIAFEAEPSTYEIGLKNILQNNLSNVQLNHSALWNIETTLKFYSDKTTTATLNQGFFAKTDHFTEVTTTLLSKFINRPIDFLKMDIEGAERNVFLDLNEKSCLNYVRQMCIECHLLKGDTENLIEILSTLKSNHFKVMLGTHKLVNYDFHQPQDCMIYAQNNS